MIDKSNAPTTPQVIGYFLNKKDSIKKDYKKCYWYEESFLFTNI